MECVGGVSLLIPPLIQQSHTAALVKQRINSIGLSVLTSMHKVKGDKAHAPASLGCLP
jgi:hypothetical protein